MDLFDQNLDQKMASEAPLAERMRPTTLEHFFGQNEVIGSGKMLRQLIEKDDIPSLIFWGPPGSGKTTLARIIANMTNADFISFSAVSSGVKDLKEIILIARDKRKFNNRPTILFIDEIHRWNKSQQDALLPYVENGIVTLIGATTENPSFEVNSALLSRTKIFVLNQLSETDLLNILNRALANKEQGLGIYKSKVDDETLLYLAKLSNGDARASLNALEFAIKATKSNKNGIIKLDTKIIKEALQKSHIYDKSGEQHYNIISALHKSLRGSDADAALYWLARMLEAGENPLYVARRLVRFASEDVGLANSRALEQAVAGYQATHFMGLPECNIVLAQVVVYLAKCPKSNQIYRAYLDVQKDVKETMDEPVPLHLRNAPTKLMKDLNYGKDYKYSPDFNYEEDQDYLPESLRGKKYLK
ncbi:replication-associated recombination protein A [Candidatus Falkowbacteria bacterium]|uniref:Replication-associated recombination protein A n=1 Tax=Candidatus Buchananbacteria bacterium CG10_big_fil_rev_8_21_14_0_10_33_19 TaxID=1974525 RepID=A0A2H0W337_9BACT|nr:replication-associated recombination protein A [Candidatus Falkowbacteria bacterium]PIS05783.1 MAG: AAA family ATPase [Candidatus Buchananbacteria bacterium CG10_big_fil_rev_8_21_14_0_10_33_19]